MQNRFNELVKIYKIDKSKPKDTEQLPREVKTAFKKFKKVAYILVAMMFVWVIVMGLVIKIF